MCVRGGEWSMNQDFFSIDKRMFAVNTGYSMTLDLDPGDAAYNKLEHFQKKNQTGLS